MERFHVVVLLKDPPEHPVSVSAALLHARAADMRTKYRTVVLMVFFQLFLAAFMAFRGAPANAIVICILSQGFSVAAMCGFAAWLTRKDFLK